MSDSGADQWATDSYSRDDIYTRSTDGPGQSETLYARIPASLAGMISHIVQSRQFPALKTNSCIVRDALYHRLHTYAEWIKDGKLDRELNVSLMLAKVEYHRLQLQEKEDFMRLKSDLLLSAAKTGDTNLLRTVLAETKAEARTMDEPWRSDLLEIIAPYLEDGEDA